MAIPTEGVVVSVGGLLARRGERFPGSPQSESDRPAEPAVSAGGVKNGKRSRPVPLRGVPPNVNIIRGWVTPGELWRRERIRRSSLL